MSEEFNPEDWDIGPDGRPIAMALFGLNVGAVPPGRVLLRIEYGATPEEFDRAKAGLSRPSALQVSIHPEEVLELARYLHEAATAALAAKGH